MTYERWIQTYESPKSDDGELMHKNDKIFEDGPKQSSRLVFFLLLSIFLIVIAAVCIRLTYKDSYLKAILQIWTIFAITILTLAAGSLVVRMGVFFSELENLQTKYDGQLSEVFIATFDFNLTSIIIIVLCCCYFAIYSHQYEGISGYEKYFSKLSILILLASIVFCHIIDLLGSRSITLQTLDTLEGIDYGSGMAFGYFYGYLRIILPPDGAQNPGIRQKMIDYESHHNVTIPVKKLFILIPKSGHIPADLKDASDDWLEGTTSLENVIRDRAGTQRRSYKNTVYKIHPGGEESHRRPVYITVEGATPMLTLNEIIKHSHKQTEVYRRSRKEIVAKFYQTLQESLDSDPDCRDVCELIYYDDYPSNKKLNIGEILLDRIRINAPKSY